MNRNVSPKKLVIVVNEGLPAGLAANTCAVLSATVTKSDDSFIGPDVTDASGSVHPGITALPIPVLKADTETMRGIRSGAHSRGLFCAGFTKAAQTCRSYAEYVQRMAASKAEELEYSGLVLYGQAQDVSRLTGGLPLL